MGFDLEILKDPKGWTYLGTWEGAIAQSTKYLKKVYLAAKLHEIYKRFTSSVVQTSIYIYVSRAASCFLDYAHHTIVYHGYDGMPMTSWTRQNEDLGQLGRAVGPDGYVRTHLGPPTASVLANGSALCGQFTYTTVIFQFHGPWIGMQLSR